MSSLTVDHHCNEISTTVKWKINNFSAQASRDNPNALLKSEEFSLYKSRLSFCLRFEPTNRQTNADKTYSSMYLMIQNLDNENEIQFKFKFWIENEDGKRIGDQKELNNKFDKSKCGHGFPKFVRHSHLYPPSDFVKNDLVYVCCEITQNLSQKWFKKIPLNDSDILKCIYKSNKDSKLTIQIKKRKLENINKSLLTLRSDVFHQMLENDNFVESKNFMIKIEDFNEKTVEAFIEFMHVGYVTQENIPYAHELLMMSDKYNVKQLKDECIQILGKRLNKDNILNYLKTAFMNHVPEFKEVVLGYITKNNSDFNIKTLMKTKEWKDFVNENEKISDEIIDAVFAKVKFV